MSNRSVLVTGGLGFLGSHLVDKLSSDGHSVVIVDNATTNAVDIDFYEGIDNVRVIMSNVLDYVPEEGFDVVFHLASVVGPAGLLKHAGDIGYSIMNDTKRILDICIQQNAMLILLSSSEVYGRDGIFVEDIHKIIPGKVAIRTEYGAGKLLAEIAVINKARVADFKYHIIRPFNITGPRQRSLGGFVLPRFIESAIRNKPITVFGDGTQKRAFSHVFDIVDGILRVTYSETENEVWNIGNVNNLTTINNLAQLVKRITGTKSEIIHINPKDIYGLLYEETSDRLPNIGKIQKALNWSPQYNLVDIVRDTFEYYRGRSGERVE